MADETVMLIVRFIAATFVAVAILYGLLRTGLAWRLALDEPNQRSLHQCSVPRMGAWGVIPAAIICGVWEQGTVALAVSFLAAVSFLDDRFGVPFLLRLGMHILAAVFFLFSAGLLLPDGRTVGMVILIVWGTNLFNFMDGSDGMAGGMALFGFGTYACSAWAADHILLMMMSAAIAGAALGFLVFNFHPAKVFLGDAGSIPLGFLAGVLGLLGWNDGVWPWWFPLVAFAPFLADATLTLLMRIKRGERFWQAHREHYYQRLIRSGLGHAETALLAYFLMALSGGVALFATHSDMSIQLVTISSVIFLLIGVGWWVNVRWRTYCLQHFDKSE